MKASLALLAVFALCSSALAERKSFEGYQVLSLLPKTQEHLDMLNEVKDKVYVDFWTEPSELDEPVTIMVPSDVVSSMKDMAAFAGIPMEVVNSNVESQVNEEQLRLEANAEKGFSLEDFNRLDDIMAWMQDIKERCAEGLTCETYSIGKTFEGRDIMVLKISKPGSGRKTFWLDSAIHAREWIAPATLLKITDHLINDYSTDSTVQRLVDKFDWYIAPMLNPDGYKFSWDSNRYWRKNRRTGNRCAGVDLNRNYDVEWMSDGTSSWACSDTYRGKSAASEPETQAVQQEALRVGRDVLAWVSIHSYSDLWLTPYGNKKGGKCEFPADYNDIMDVANAAADAIRNTYSTSWRSGSVCSVLYAASGSTVDYVKSKAGVKYSFTPELRGRDFVIKPQEITPSYREIWNGVVAMVAKIEEIERL